jgi:outer membrane immunogenic protein
MKQQWLAGAALAALSIGSAVAADMPVKAIPPGCPGCNWNGYYVGVNLGGGFAQGRGNDGISLTPAGTFAAVAPGVANPISNTSYSESPAGFLGGGQIGYNWQMPGSQWIFGVEVDGQGTSQSTSIVGAGGTLTESLPWFATARGRVGYAITPTIMLYGTGGLAVVDHKFSAPGASQDDTRAGWTAGAGIEGAISRNWSWKLEYLHLDVATFTPANTAPVTVRVTDEIVRVGANFHF